MLAAGGAGDPELETSTQRQRVYASLVRVVVPARSRRPPAEERCARGCDSRTHRGVPLRAGGRAAAEGCAEPADDLAGRADVARAARGSDDVAARDGGAVHGLPVPGRRARPRTPLGDPAAARHDRRVRAAARLLPDEAARGPSRGDRRRRDHRRARPVRLLRRPCRWERERVQPRSGRSRSACSRCSRSCCSPLAVPAASR